MSRYRKIEVRTWMDEKFRSLSPMQASGQGLWLFLMTGPHTGPIPGLFRAGRAGMAEELEWDIEAFDEAFLEVFDQGMAKADFRSRLVWLPKALQYNKPESPNVVRSWRTELDLLPECDLKSEAIESMRHHLKTLGDSYMKAFEEICPEENKPSAKPLPKPSVKTMPNQEQEQEQEQEQDKDTDNAQSQSSQFDAFWFVYPKKKNKEKARRSWRRKKLDCIADLIISDVKNRIAGDWDWTKDDGRYVPYPTTYLEGKRWEDEITTVPSGGKPRGVAASFASAVYTETTDEIDWMKD